MFKEVTIRNFKAIRDLTIKLTPFTMLIGENSSGKSTVLQALDFLCNTAFRDIDEYLKDREWTFDDVRSQFAGEGEGVSFSARIGVGGTEVVWDISIVRTNDKWIIKERVKDNRTEKIYLSFGNEADDYPHNFSQLNLGSSALKTVNIEPTNPNDIEEHVIRKALKVFLILCSSYELLSPERMRSGSRGSVVNIGIGGEKLAAYIHGMNPTVRNELNQTVSDIVGHDIVISTITNGESDWVEMFVEEIWNGNTTKVKQRYLSDGLLRIVCLCVILLINGKWVKPYFPDELVLLDEIEDGINPTLAEKLINSFQECSKINNRQFIITTHSPIMVNYVDKENIIYMWRERDGSIKAKPMFSTERMLDTLEFLNPGEAWFYYTKEEIIERLSNGQEDGKDGH